jgi:hypothetical protein
MDMNRKLYSLVLVALSVLMLHATGVAQSNLHVRANVPFGFTLENKNFNAGTYDITQLEPSVLTFQNAADGTSIMIRVSEAHSEVSDSPTPALVFHRYGEKYFLAQVARPQTNAAMTVPVGTQEKELARAKSSRDLIAVRSTTSQAGSR